MSTHHQTQQDHEVFDGGWLEVRAPFDEAARSHRLQTLAADYLRSAEQAVVLDLGCGSGNNIAYLSRQWSFVHDWIGLDHEESLLAMTRRRFEQGPVTVNTVRGDLFDLGAIDLRPTPTLAVANAVFDLFTPNQMKSLLEWLRDSGLPLLATLHYRGMAWRQVLEDEAWVIQQYEEHMKRPRNGQPGLGPEAPSVIRHLVQRMGGHIQEAPANWDIPADSKEMQGFLLGFMERSVPEMIDSREAFSRFHTWLAARKKEPSQLEVTHQDMWITW